LGLIRNKTVKLFFGICPVYWGLVQCSNMWYHGLKNAYPLEFLLYTQYSTNHPNSRVFAKTIFSKKVNLKIQKLLEFRLDHEDVDYLNSIISQIDDRITQKEKQLKN